jgi:branched-chain amino acid transport system substrate-binding protein
MSLRFCGPSRAALAGVLLLLAACGGPPGPSRALRSASDALAERRYAESAVLFEQVRATAQTPEERGRAVYGLAEISFARERHEEALPLYRQVAEDASTPARLRLAAQEGLGRTLRALGHKSEAHEALQGFFRQMQGLSDVERMGLRGDDPLLPSVGTLETQAGYALGLTRYELGHLESAAAVLERVLPGLPPGMSQAQAYRILAHAHRAAGRGQEALESLGRAYVVAPAEPPVLRCELLEAQAEIYQEQERRLSAVEALERVVQLCPARDARGRMSELIALLGVEELRALMGRYPHSPPGDDAAFHLARTLGDEGDLRGAIDLLREATAAYGGSPMREQFQDEVRNLELRLVVDPRAIGFVGPLSGRLAQVGREILGGAQLAIREHNEMYPSDPFRLLPSDAAASPEADQGAIATLARDSRVIAIIGPVTTAAVQASATLIDELGVPAISPSATGESLADTSRFVFRNGLSLSSQIRRVVEFAVLSLGLRRFAILYPASSYGQLVREELRNAVAAHGGLLVGESAYPPESTDFKGPILQIKAGLPEVVFLPGDVGTVTQIAPQLLFHDLDAVLLGTSALNTDEAVGKFAQTGVRHFENLYLADDYFEGSDDPLTRGFVERYRQTYGRAPSRLAAQSYDTARLLILKILEDGNRANRALLARKLALPMSFRSVTGMTGFDPKGESIKELKVLGFQDGRFVQVQ